MEREERFHNKITWFTFVFSTLVVWVHAVNITEGRGAAFENFFAYTLGQIAVPGFFMVSGYLFYRNFSWGSLRRKWESRIRSVLVPYVLWNGLYYIGYVVGSRLPFLAGVVEKGEIPFNWYAAADAVLHYTYNYVFWYLYQLILLIMLAPVLYGILENKVIGGAALAVVFYLAQRGVIIPQINLDALFYYSLAAFGGIHGKSLAEGEQTAGKTVAGGTLVAGAVFLYTASWPGVISSSVCYRVMVPLGLWFLADPRRLPKARWWMGYNFFIYAVHFALVRLVNKAAVMAWGEDRLIMEVLFFAMPAAVVVLGSRTGAWLRRHFPMLWSLLNGGRQ